MNAEDSERIEAVKKLDDDESSSDSYNFDPKNFRSWRESDTRIEEYGSKPPPPAPQEPPNYDNEVLHQIICYKEQGLLLPKYDKIHAQIVETYRKYGYLYREKSHVLSLIKKASKWAFACLIIASIMVIYVMLVVKDTASEEPASEFHMIVVSVLIFGLLFCLIGTYREYYRYTHEFVTVSATLIIVEKANYKWLNLRGTSGNWPTRHYGSAKTLKQSVFEQWIAKRSQPITVDAAGNQDIEELHNRPHVKDAERLKIAVEISSYISGGANNITAING